MTDTTMRAVVHDTFAEPAEVPHVEERPGPTPGAGGEIGRANVRTSGTSTSRITRSA